MARPATVATGEALLGAHTDSIPGEKPHTWWSLPGATLAVCHYDSNAIRIQMLKKLSNDCGQYLTPSIQRAELLSQARQRLQ